MKFTLIKPGIGSIIDGYDIDKGSMEPLSMAILAALVRQRDEAVFYDDRLETIPYDEHTDAVLITVETFSARRAYAIAGEFRQRGVPVVLGGMHISLLPEEAEKYADCVVTGDVEPVWTDLRADLMNGRLRKRYHGQLTVPQQGVQPDRSIFGNKRYLPVSLIQFSRGCRFNCSFCSVSSFFGHRHQCREIDDVLHEVEHDRLKTLLFVDDNLIADRKQLKLFLRELAPLKVRWASQSSIDMVSDPELMRLMADSGCIGNLIGFESINIQTLEWFNKSPNLRNFNNYREALAILRDHHMLTWASFMIGNDFDTPETIDKTLEFAIKNKFTLSFFHVLMPYPGTKIYEQFRQQGRLLYGDAWWLHPGYRYNHATFRPVHMSPEELTEATIRVNKEFYTNSSILKRAFDAKTHLADLFRAVFFFRFNYILKKTST